MNTPEQKDDHGIANARGWYSTICELVAALECDYDRLEKLREAMQDRYDDLPEPDTHQPKTTFEHYLSAMIVDGDEEAEELAELTTVATLEGELQINADAVRERIQQGPLSVEVRSGWHTPSDNNTPEDFCILLSTGGPALRIRGKLDEHAQPTRAWLEYQDWGTPWTELHTTTNYDHTKPDECHTINQNTLLTYCQQFYFGE